MQLEEPPIYVTRPSLPLLEELMPYLERIWESRILTNGGPFHQRLEKELADYLGVKYVCLFNNGTNALMTAVQALGLKGEVITTPFSFVATANALVWNSIKPVFVDIDPETFNLDPAKIEEAITPETTGIVPVHCFGRPCDTVAIGRIANKHGLKVLYDAAHAFGVQRDRASILNEGDLSVLSFHATKVFNTFEGGAIVCHNEAMKKRIESLRNFGIVGEAEATEVGLNGKMNEFQAAVGLAQLQHVEPDIAKRADVAAHYDEELGDVVGITVPMWPTEIRNNHSYYPILVEEGFGLSRDGLHEHLKQTGVFGRRYFFPLISDMAAHVSAHAFAFPSASSVAERVLCIPMHAHLDRSEVARVVNEIGGASV